MKKTIVAGLTGLLLATGPVSTPAQADADTQDRIQSTRATIEQWVDVRQRIARTRSDWRQEKQMIENRIRLFSEEIEALQSSIEDLEERVTGAERERARLQQEADELRRASLRVDNIIGDYEQRLRGKAEYFPRPLRDRVAQFLERMPEDPDATGLSVSERMAFVVGLLNEVDTFNNQITMMSERRELPDGRLAEVTTMYFGLAQAFYVDGQGQYAGVGTPARGGWEWESRDEIAPAVRNAARFYRDRGEAAYVQLPLKIHSIPGSE